MGDRCGGRIARHTGCTRGGARGRQTPWTWPNAGKLPFEVGINSVWVLVAGILVMFMQAGFAFLEIGFSRGKNAGTVIAKILVNFSIARSASGRSASPSRSATATQIIGTSGFFLAGDGRERELRAGQRRRGHGHGRDAVVLPVRLLRRLAGDRLGHDARARQVRRVRDLRDRLLVAHLPDRRALDLRWRLAGDAVRRAGLRRFDGRPPDRRDRRSRGAAAARPASRQVRRGRQAAGHPRPQHAAVRPRRADPVARLVRLQPGLRPERARRALPGDRDGHEPRGRRRCARRRRRDVRRSPRRSTSAWRATARSPAWSPSPPRRATSSCGPRRSSAPSPA